MTNELLFQLGINWKLFLSQAVNFFILLGVLTFFVYKPLIKVIKERNQKISEGLKKMVVSTMAATNKMLNKNMWTFLDIFQQPRCDFTMPCVFNTSFYIVPIYLLI